jgi:hypothetical protein
MISILWNGLDHTDTLDSAVLACACVAFWGQCRLGKLLGTSSLDMDTSMRPAIHNLCPSTKNHRSWLVRLPRTKTSRRGQDITLVRQAKDSDPLKALRIHLKLNNLPANSPLFAFKTTCGICTLTQRVFLTRCNKLWTKANLPHTTGHSFHIGGTTALLVAGVSPDVVKVMGHWTLDAFHRYWQSLEDIVPLHVENLHTPNRHSKRHI